MLTYIGVPEFAAAAEVCDRVARRAVLKGRWRGNELRVRVVRGQGGRAGARYEIEVASLPADIVGRIALQPRQTELPLIVVSEADKSWKRSLVQPIMAAGAAGSSARAAALRQVAAVATYPAGKRKGQPIPERTLRAWIAAYEAKGATALHRARRADKSKPRVIVSRAWDAVMTEASLPPDQQAELAKAACLCLKSLWASGASSASNVLFIAQPKLREIALSGVPGLSTAQLDRVCRLPAGFARRHQRARLAHKKRTDAGGWAANHRPRIRRHRDDLLPMQIVAGDVRHSDIMILRADGTMTTPKMVVFMDLATNRVFCHLVIVALGEMIRREHVLAAMRAMFADPSWGVPQQFYFDNGGEFNTGPATDDLCRIVQLVRDTTAIEMGVFDAEMVKNTGIFRSLPYNPQSKVIETIFSILTRSVEPQFPGFIGGNRMVPKVENQGRAKLPMPGDADAIAEQYRIMIDFYNAKPQQRGHVRGKSPNAAFQKLCEKGWQSVVCDPAEFTLTFGNDEYRKVQTGGEFQCGGQLYRHDALAIRVGERIRIRVPILDAGGRIPVLDDKGEVLCVAAPPPVFAMRDIEGSKEGARQTSALNKAVLAEIAGVQTVNMAEQMARAVAELPKAPVPTPLAQVSSHPVLQAAAQDAGAGERGLPVAQTARSKNAQLFADMQRIAESGRAA